MAVSAFQSASGLQAGAEHPARRRPGRRRPSSAHLGVEVPVRTVFVFLTGTVLSQITIKQMPEDVLLLDRTDTGGSR